jgi:hypothetical protein
MATGALGDITIAITGLPTRLAPRTAARALVLNKIRSSFPRLEIAKRSDAIERFGKVNTHLVVINP